MLKLAPPSYPGVNAIETELNPGVATKLVGAEGRTATAVAVKVNGLLGKLAEVTVKVCVPCLSPKIHFPNAAIPFAFVVTVTDDVDAETLLKA